MFVTNEGRQIDRSDEQYENADSPRIESRQSGANVKVESAVQLLKHNVEMTSINDGMQIE
jgi:hypothetical protein